MRRVPSAAVALMAMMTTAVVAIDPIIIKGTKFFNSKSGEQFYIKGIAYQQGVAAGGAGTISGGHPDPLADPAACKRDVQYLKELETNLIRVYAVDPTANHDACMSTFAAAGIYVLADLSSPEIAIITTDPQWTDEIYNRYISVIDSLHSYPNTFGFFAGNEVVTNGSNTDAAAYVKAAVRDSKAYIKAKGYRNGLGVGYATNDNVAVRGNLPKYFDCGDKNTTADFWGLNIYEWCSPQSTFANSGYSDRVAQFKNYDKPVFFSEYGCNTDPPRLFKDTPVLLGPDMDQVFSGGIVYMYFQEVNNYGLVKTTGNSVSKIQPDFDNLSKEIRLAHPSTTKMAGYTPTNSPATCPAMGKVWDSQASPLPPSPNQQLCSCMVSSLKCVVNSGVSPSKYSNLFSYACSKAGSGACAGITHDSQKGIYGAYSMCNSTEQLSYAFNQYVKLAGGSCNFNGAAKSQSPAPPSSQCKSLLKQAGSKGTGTVTSSPTSTGNAGGSGGSHTPNSASTMTTPSLDLTILKMGAYVFAAALAGFGLILL